MTFPDKSQTGLPGSSLGTLIMVTKEILSLECGSLNWPTTWIGMTD